MRVLIADDDREVAEVLAARGTPFVFATGYGEHGLPARVVAVRPCSGQLEVEAVIEPAALPQGVEAPTSIRAVAPFAAELGPGAQIRLSARPEDALVFPCHDKVCRA